MSGESAEEVSTVDNEENKLISLINIDELCNAIDSEVYSMKSGSSSAENTPRGATKGELKLKTEPPSSPAAGKIVRETRKRPTKRENGPEVVKKQKITADSSEKQNESETKKEMSEDTELDIWEEDPKGLYGLSPTFLKSKGIKTPLTNWVHLSNIPCDKTVLREVMELAGNVLVCHVVRTKTGYAKVKYSHPIEAAQAVSMLNGQTLVGKTLTVSIDPGPHEVFLPMGLKTLGPGFSEDGTPLKDVARHLQRHFEGKPTHLSDALFKAETEEPTKDIESNTESSATLPEKTTETKETKAQEIKPGPTTTKHKICQTDDDGNRKIIETVNQIKKQGVSVNEIIKALKALTQSDTGSRKSVDRDVSREAKQRRSTSRERSSVRSNYESKRKHNARSVSPRRISHVTPKFGPRSGSTGPFRPNAPIPNNNFNNAGRNNNPNFGPGNSGGNFGPGPNFNSGSNSGPFNPGSGPFVQSGPGPNNSSSFGGNSGPSGPFSGNSGPPGPFGGNSGPSGPYGGNSGPSGPFGGNSGPFGGNSGPFVGNSGPPGPSGPNPPSGPFGGNSGPSGPSGPNPSFGNNLGPIGPPRQNMMGSSGPNVQQRSSSNVVVLNNLPPSVTFQLLNEKMNQCGSVQFLNITKPGTALVRYANDWEATRCIKTFDRTVVDGHQIEVHYS